MHLFAQRLPNDSFFPNSSPFVWRYSALIGRFHLKQCYFVYGVTVETDLFNATKWHLVATSGREYANESCWRQTGIGFKNDSF